MLHIMPILQFEFLDATQHGTTKLVSYFSVLNYSLVSQEEKLIVSCFTYFEGKIFHSHFILYMTSNLTLNR